MRKIYVTYGKKTWNGGWVEKTLWDKTDEAITEICDIAERLGYTVTEIFETEEEQ